ncbi:MAG: UDP-glucose 4-epimerase GalE, partial [Bacteroidota bacterium]
LEYLIDAKNKENFDIINLGTGNGISVFEAIASFEHVSGIKLNYRVGPKREGDVEAIYSDTYKSKKVLSWSAKCTLDEMMKSAWEWEKSSDNKQ